MKRAHSPGYAAPVVDCEQIKQCIADILMIISMTGFGGKPILEQRSIERLAVPLCQTANMKSSTPV